MTAHIEPDAPEFRDPRAVLKRHGLWAKKSFSQNFLVNRGAVQKIAELAAAAPVTRVIEIGPGLGTLTAALLSRDVDVIAVERDPEMCAVLEVELRGAERLTVLLEDALEFDFWRHLSGAPTAVCGNLPYAITGKLFRTFCDLDAPGVRLVLMVQLEVAERILAPPGDKRRGALTACVDARFETKLEMKLSPGSFHPSPKVSSAVLRLVRREPPLGTPDELAGFDRAVRAAFSAKRKTLRNSLANGLCIPSERAESLCAAAGIDPRARAEQLPTSAFFAIARAIATSSAPVS